MVKAKSLAVQGAMQARDCPRTCERSAPALNRFTQTSAVVGTATGRNSLGVMERRNASPWAPAERKVPLQLSDENLTEAIRVRRRHGET